MGQALLRAGLKRDIIRGKTFFPLNPVSRMFYVSLLSQWNSNVCFVNEER